jgi:hypothetical protein
MKYNEWHFLQNSKYQGFTENLITERESSENRQRTVNRRKIGVLYLPHYTI